jgi:copper chaperone NosL
MRRGVRTVVAVLLGGMLLSACSVEPQPILFGSAECEHCRMMISDARFASQALNTRGKAYSFDAVECLASWVVAREEAGEEAAGGESLHSLHVADFSNPDIWIRVEDAHFLRSATLGSPMGMNLSAHADARRAREYAASSTDEILDWAGVLALVRSEGAHGHADHGH